MKNTIKTTLFTVILLLAMLPAVIVLGQGGGITIDKIIVKVDNYIILQSDLEASYLQFLSDGRTPNDDSKCQILQGLIVNKVLAAKAEIDSVIVEDKRVDGELDRRMQYMAAQFGSEKKIEEAYGKSVDALKTELRKTLKEQLTVQQMQDNITKDIKSRQMK
jgi:peptidyl-prolyl cis-trans isomerase SurA